MPNLLQETNKQEVERSPENLETQLSVRGTKVVIEAPKPAEPGEYMQIQNALRGEVDIELPTTSFRNDIKEIEGRKPELWPDIKDQMVLEIVKSHERVYELEHRLSVTVMTPEAVKEHEKAKKRGVTGEITESMALMAAAHELPKLDRMPKAAVVTNILESSLDSVATILAESGVPEDTIDNFTKTIKVITKKAAVGYLTPSFDVAGSTTARRNEVTKLIEQEYYNPKTTEKLKLIRDGILAEPTGEWITDEMGTEMFKQAEAIVNAVYLEKKSKDHSELDTHIIEGKKQIATLMIQAYEAINTQAESQQPSIEYDARVADVTRNLLGIDRNPALEAEVGNVEDLLEVDLAHKAFKFAHKRNLPLNQRLDSTLTRDSEGQIDNMGIKAFRFNMRRFVAKGLRGTPLMDPRVQNQCIAEIEKETDTETGGDIRTAAFIDRFAVVVENLNDNVDNEALKVSKETMYKVALGAKAFQILNRVEPAFSVAVDSEYINVREPQDEATTKGWDEIPDVGFTEGMKNIQWYLTQGDREPEMWKDKNFRIGFSRSVIATCYAIDTANIDSHINGEDPILPEIVAPRVGTIEKAKETADALLDTILPPADKPSKRTR